MTYNDPAHLRLPQNDPIGTLIGDVRIASVLSQGPQGLVLLGTQEGIGRLAVVKLLPEGGQRHSTFMQNAQILSRLRHANVVTLYDTGLHENRYPYIVMEYLAEGSLKTIMDSEGTLEPVRALGMLLQVVHALEDVHRENLLHRNISLENVLVASLAGSGHDLVKLSNFGLSGDDPARESSRPAAYITPEEGLGGTYTASSDLYACGVLLYKLLTGKLPYRHPNPPELWDEIVSGKPVPLQEASPALGLYPELQHFMDQALAKNPAARPTNARAMRLRIGQVINDIQRKDVAVSQHQPRSFPVINTIERLPVIPRTSPRIPTPMRTPRPHGASKRSGEDPTSYRAHTPISTPSPDQSILPPPAPRSHSGSGEALRGDPIGQSQIPLPMTQEMPAQQTRTATSVHQQEDLLDSIRIEALTWATPMPENLAHAQDMPYMVLIIHNPNGQVPPGLTHRLEILLGSTLNSNTVAVVFKPTSRPAAWIAHLAARAREHHLMMGVAFGRRFDAMRLRPAPYTVRMAIQAAGRSLGGELIAARHAIDALSLERYFASLDSRLAGRYTSFMRYVGL